MLNLKNAFLETRPQFLILSLMLVMIGGSTAFYHGYWHIPHLILTLIGLIAFHISVNALNDYFDFKTGIDLKTKRTPFSGGSGILPTGKLMPKQVLLIGLISLGIGLLIGIYFVFAAGWELIPILLLGIISITLYNPLLSKIMIGEIFAGLGLGLLPVVGIYFIFTGKFTPTAVFAGVPPFLLTFNFLLLNEFPDAEADKSGGRKHIIILFGKRKAGLLYSFFTILVYLWIVGGVISGEFSPWTLLALLTIPFGVKAIEGALINYDNFEELIKAQGANVIVVLATQALFAIGFFIGGLIKL